MFLLLTYSWFNDILRLYIYLTSFSSMRWENVNVMSILTRIQGELECVYAIGGRPRGPDASFERSTQWRTPGSRESAGKGKQKGSI